MAREDGRIEKGQKLSQAISARAWNRAQLAADRVLGVGTGATGDGPGGSSAPYTWVYCKNASGYAVNRWGILKITGVEVTPTSDDAAAETRQFQDMPVLTGRIPEDDSSAFAVAVEPIANGKIGRVAVDGVVQVKLNVVQESDRFAKTKYSVGGLETAGAGPFVIVWKEAGTGSGKWALVRLGGFPTIVRGRFLGPWNKGATTTVVDTPDGVNYTAKNYFVTIPENTFQACAIAYTAGEWILIAAEC